MRIYCPAFASNIEFAWKDFWLKMWNHSSLIIGICEVIAVLGNTGLSRAQLIFLYFIYLYCLSLLKVFFSYRPFIRPKIGKLHEASGMVCNIQWLILLLHYYYNQNKLLLICLIISVMNLFLNYLFMYCFCLNIRNLLVIYINKRKMSVYLSVCLLVMTLEIYHTHSKIGWRQTKNWSEYALAQIILLFHN